MQPSLPVLLLYVAKQTRLGRKTVISSLAFLRPWLPRTDDPAPKTSRFRIEVMSLLPADTFATIWAWSQMSFETLRAQSSCRRIHRIVRGALGALRGVGRCRIPSWIEGNQVSCVGRCTKEICGSSDCLLLMLAANMATNSKFQRLRTTPNLLSRKSLSKYCSHYSHM